jgi:hypothetical protein
MVFGMVLMTLQVIAEFFKDLATLMGKGATQGDGKEQP